MLDNDSQELGESPGRFRLASLAKHILASRADRSIVLDPDLFAEPAWDILLSLYVANVESCPMQVSWVCNESGVAATTALRWIDRLIELRLVRRHQNPGDARSSFLELDKEGRQKMDQILQQSWSNHFPV